MQKAMAYWGPDGDGTWCEDHVGVGNLRRNNTPESLGDALPWTCPASGDVITASVRLDNRDELFNALSIPRPDRAEIPDSRIILSAYHQWGDYQTMIVLHMLTGQLMLIAIPFTKLGHMVFFFFVRILIGSEFSFWRGNRMWLT